MEIILNRYEETHRGTYGEMSVGNRVFKTIERPWKDNKPFESCVPPGRYDLIPHHSDHHGDVYALVNRGLNVYHYAEDIPDGEIGRYGILIHVANNPEEVVGCIGIGLGLGFVNKKIAITASRNAMNKFRELVDYNEEHTLRIIGL